jgi:hypothetical protein
MLRDSIARLVIYPDRVGNVSQRRNGKCNSKSDMKSWNNWGLCYHNSLSLFHKYPTRKKRCMHVLCAVILIYSSSCISIHRMNAPIAYHISLKYHVINWQTNSSLRRQYFRLVPSEASSSARIAKSTSATNIANWLCIKTYNTILSSAKWEM